MKTFKPAKLLRPAILAPLLFVAAFAIVAVVYMSFHVSPQVDVTGASFSPQKIQIAQEETIRFVNRSSTTTQVLCIGSNQHCDTSAFIVQTLPPQVLLGPTGLRLAPGETKDIVFANSGTFHITSTAVPGMDLTVMVSEGMV